MTNELPGLLMALVLLMAGVNLYWSVRQWREWERAGQQLRKAHDAERKAMALVGEYVQALAKLGPDTVTPPTVCHGACDGCQLVND